MDSYSEDEGELSGPGLEGSDPETRLACGLGLGRLGSGAGACRACACVRRVSTEVF